MRALFRVGVLFFVGCGSGDPGTGAGSGTGGATGGSEGGAPGGDSGLADSRLSDATGYLDGDVQVVPPPVDPAKRVNELSAVELAALCDWMANLLGGYDHLTECGSGVSVRTYKDQAECMRVLFPAGCSILVAEFETCVVAQVPSQGCVYPSTACRALRNC